jgi:predicted lipoprotein with Yx(FWY)xxD motif
VANQTVEQVGRGVRRGGRRSALVTAGSVAVALIAVMSALASAAPAFAKGSESKHTLVVETVKVHKIGTVLATASGFTLYRFTANSRGKSTCTGACAKVWPPLQLPKGDHIKGPHGIKGFSTIRVAHGQNQVTLDGVALYRYSGDTKKDQAKGQGVEGKWFAALPSQIHSVTAKAPTTTTVPVTTGTTGTTKTTSTMPAVRTTTPATSPPTTPVTSPPTTSPPPTTAPPSTTVPTTTTTIPGGGYGY